MSDYRGAGGPGVHSSTDNLSKILRRRFHIFIPSGNVRGYAAGSSSRRRSASATGSEGDRRTDRGLAEGETDEIERRE